MMFRFVLSLLFLAGAFSQRVVITSGADFVRALGGGGGGGGGDGDVSYTGSTLVLANDIVLTPQESELFLPIGANKMGAPFRGTLDGQGHIVSGLNATVPKLYVGLVGRSSGASIRGVVLDESCEFGSTFVSSLKSGSDLHVGSFAGLCADCLIERCVSMARVAFTGWLSHLYTSGGRAYMGGIAGALSGVSAVRGCGMYGLVEHAGSSKNADLGGLVGAVLPGSTAAVVCTGFYGTIQHGSFTRWDLSCGGVVGAVHGDTDCSVLRSMSGGVMHVESAPDRKSVGVFIGGAYNSTGGGKDKVRVNSSAWDKEQVYPLVGWGESEPEVLDAYPLALTWEGGRFALKRLGAYEWAVVEYNGRFGRFASEKLPLRLLTPRAALPVPAKEGAGVTGFGGWFVDEQLTRPYNSSAGAGSRSVIAVYPKMVGRRSVVSDGALVVLVVVVLGAALHYYRRNGVGRRRMEQRYNPHVHAY